MATTPSNRKIAAHHEAGHAVVALAFHLTVRSVSIRPRAAIRGRVITHGLPNEPADVLLFITLAGPFAHRRFAPRSNWLTGDFATVHRMIFGKRSKITATNKEKYLADIVDKAEQIVDYFWTDIKVAAKALFKHETLTGDEISAVIRAARRKSRRRRRIGDPPEFALAPARGSRTRIIA
jgi:ATP-dependent Zn protease